MIHINELTKKGTVSTLIPIIDFHPFITGDISAKELIANNIIRTLRETGCFYLENHGVSPAIISQAFDQSKRFFALPLEEKKQSAYLMESAHKGYDLRNLYESFHFGQEINQYEENSVNNPFEKPNKWPLSQPELREVMLQFFDACHESMLKLIEALAIALQLPESYFRELHCQKNHGTSFHKYCAASEIPESEAGHLKEHTDPTTFTYIFQDEVGGLEIKTLTGEWIAAPHIPDTVLVLAGEILQRWTNDQVCAPRHQVVISPQSRCIKSRYSLAFFAAPDNDAEIICPESCLEANKAAKYPPILTSEFYTQRYSNGGSAY
jgi:isopenicillin N synthase-like dioxygenase